MLSFSGIPSTNKNLRAIIWRLLLGSLPKETQDWQDQLESNLQIYDAFKKELIVEPDLEEDPLSKNGKWNTFFKDQEIWELIEKDVKRTRTDMNFFC